MAPRKLISSIFSALAASICTAFALFALVACANEREEPEIIGITATNTVVTYDGFPHFVAIDNLLDTDTVLYSVGNGEYSAQIPELVMPGEYTVHYKVIRAGYKEFVGSTGIKIIKSVLDGISADSPVVKHDGRPHTIDIRGVLDGDILSYSTDGNNFSPSAPTFADVGQYTVYYRVDRAYGDFRASCVLTIVPVLTGRYLNPDLGIVELTDDSAIVNDNPVTLDYDHTYAGRLDGKEFSLAQNVLTYDGNVYTALSSADRVYKLRAADKTVYFTGADAEKLTVEFDADGATICRDTDELLTVDDVNYCENGSAKSYSPLVFELDVAGGSERICNVSVKLSTRTAYPRADSERCATYNGEPHGLDITPEAGVRLLYRTNDDWSETAPTFTEIGVHSVSVMYITSEYLPQPAVATIVILPDPTGVYCNNDGVIEISANGTRIDGIAASLTVKNRAWTINDNTIECVDSGIKFNGKMYTKTTDRIIVFIVGTTRIMRTRAVAWRDVVLIYKNNELTITPSGEAKIVCTLTGTRLEVTLNGIAHDVAPTNENDGYMSVLGTDELKRASVLVVRLTIS